MTWLPHAVSQWCEENYWALKPPTHGEFTKEQNNVSWTEAHLFGPLFKSNRRLFALYGVLKRNQKIDKSSCSKESNLLWPFLFLHMNYFHPVSFIYLWSWEFSCDRRSLWHGARTGPTLGNGLFLCICRNEKFFIDRSEFLSTATDSGGNVRIYVTGELVRTPQSKVAAFGEDSQVIVSVTWNWIVQRKSVEHTVIALDALLYVNHRQVDGELKS